MLDTQQLPNDLLFSETVDEQREKHTVYNVHLTSTSKSLVKQVIQVKLSTAILATSQIQPMH
jgi:hypothetical protein